jgi:hypothetical protein
MPNESRDTILHDSDEMRDATIEGRSLTSYDGQELLSLAQEFEDRATEYLTNAKKVRAFANKRRSHP